MYCEECRVREAQQNLIKWFARNFGVNRLVTEKDTKTFIEVKKSNQSSRKSLFGSSDWVWYLTEEGYNKNDIQRKNR